LVSFTLIVFFGPKMGRRGVGAGYLATGAILASLVLSLFSLTIWIGEYGFKGEHHHDGEVQTDIAMTPEHPAPVTGEGHSPSANKMTEDQAVHKDGEHGEDQEHGKEPVAPIDGNWYTLAAFGDLEITIGYYIDALTLVMFTMVTIIASCIHFYSFGYMHEELGGVTDPQVKTSDGKPFRRAGRFYRFYQYLSLFCFSMLGLVIAGNIAMVFVFWELVGICSYFLIGFYIERKSASNAANKAFIVNRVGDFGMIIGLMVIFTTLGTFSFGEIFEQVRPADSGYELQTPEGMVLASAKDEVAQIRLTAPDQDAAQEIIDGKVENWRTSGYGYGLLMLAGIGIFCGCIGKSAQFPLHVWLPDAMEGPTPVSALIHAATMVAAGVYLVGRFYPAFTPEVLLVIAIVGAITLFMAATIAITATDIKRVLAYSTLSQLGYMTLALGVGGWVAGLFHLITHAFFKALLFLCSGSVIHACGTNEMPKMGGLLKKMPYTAYTMLIGCLAISGAGIPLLIGFSGYHSKDSILAQAFAFSNFNPTIGTILFWTAASGAAITAFYMFRLWFMTFTGEPRNKHAYEHAHESPRSMVMPLIVLATFAVVAGWNIPFVGLGARPLLDQARPSGVELGLESPTVVHPSEISKEEGHGHNPTVHDTVSFIAFFTALTGFLLAGAFYGLNLLDPDDGRRRFFPIYWFLKRKWYFDELYQAIFIRPVMAVASAVSMVDQKGIDWIADGSARFMRWVSSLDGWIDRVFVDGTVNGIGNFFYKTGLHLRRIQTGNLQAYVMWIAVGTIALFVFTTLYWG
jgi:NADH-quinone oxidoreductase subunit L